MNTRLHADRTEKMCGLRAEDIHRWIDGLFDVEGFDQFLRVGRTPGYDPYDHRKFRHCAEALPEAYAEFKSLYTRDQIRAVFESHVRDDYDGYLPCREDFENGTFAEKYHEDNGRAEGENILSETERAQYFRREPYGRSGPGSFRKHLGFYLRIVLPTALAVILFIASIFLLIVPFFRSQLLNRKREMIRELTTAAATEIGYFIEQEKAGAMTPAEARRIAAEEIRHMRYGREDKDYFWITDMHPRMIMHPYRPELESRDLKGYRDMEDPAGIRLFDAAVNLVREREEGYLEYRWQWMDDPARIAPKLSYVKAIPEWNWIIGTGIYLDDVREEMSRLTGHLKAVFGGISSVLIVILLYIVYQTRRIENMRVQAQEGLREAKDRYRALVESSREGYILHIEGRTMYSNRALQHMLGYSEDELAARPLRDLLTDEECNTEARNELEALDRETVSWAEFEVRLRTRGGEAVDAVMTVSRIFFSRKNGHVISFRKSVRTRTQSALDFYRGIPADAAGGAATHPGFLDTARGIARAATAGQVIHVLERLPAVIRGMTDQGVRPDILRATVGEAYDAATRHFTEFSIRDLGAPPAAWALISMGSNARHEMTMFSDQDNALVFLADGARDAERKRRYFLRLADAVCSRLNQAGFPYCRGGIMAAHPAYCLSMAEWKKQLTQCIEEVTVDAAIRINVIFDMRGVCGDAPYADELIEHILQTCKQNPECFIHFARHSLDTKPPINALGFLKAENREGARRINIKDCMKPIESFARLYAMRHGVREPGTPERLARLTDMGFLSEDTRSQMTYSFNYLWRLRFYNQLLSGAELRHDYDQMDIDRLTDLERQNFRNVLAAISAFQSKLSYDFLGRDLR